MNKDPKISVCIPVYEAKGEGVSFLKKNLKGILKQSYKNYEIIISDHSQNNVIQNYVLKLGNEKITYLRYKHYRGNGAYNTNNAINNSNGDYIKIMNQDDYIDSSDFFKNAIENLKTTGNKWLISTFKHLDYENNTFFKSQIPSFGVEGAPKTAYSREHALKTLEFPVICKPLKTFPRGHDMCGEIINEHINLPTVVLNREDLTNINEDDEFFPTSDLYDTYHEVKSYNLLDGINLIGCPSVALIPRGELIDTNVTYMIDCELWYRLFIKYGHPSIIGEDHPIVIGMGKHQVTRQLEAHVEAMIADDKKYCKDLHNINYSIIN